MGLTNYPNGVASFGIPQLGAPVYDMISGNPWFVCNRAGVVSGDGTARDKPFPSIADAVAKIATTNPTQSDWIVALAGHAENVTASNTFSASLVNTGAVVIPAGTRILGEGSGSLKPLLTFTAAGSTIAMAAAGITFENINVQGPQTGTTTTAAFFTVTAAYCAVRKCDMQMSTSATALVTTAISLSSAANDFTVSDVERCYTITGTPTSWLSTTGTAGPRGVRVERCTATCILSAATGALVDVSANSVTPPSNWIVDSCNFVNLATNSTVAIKGVAGCTGEIVNCRLGITNATGAATAINTPGTWQMIETYATVPGKAGLIVGTVSG